MDCYRYFFGLHILEIIVQQSNLHAVQNNPNQPLLLTVMELEQFLETVLYMACATLLKSKLYWIKLTTITMWLLLLPVIDGRK